MVKNLTRRAFACAAASAALAPRAFAQQPSAVPLKVGFVYVTPVGDAGWTWQHEQGRLQMQRALGARVQSSIVEGVPESADAERVLRDLARQGHGLIFATSFGYLEPALRVAAEFPDVKFEHAGGYKTAANLDTYNARHYEGRWLAGVLAGHASQSGIAGYVAGFPVPEVIQGIDAFALGMRSVNPRAEVRVLWLDSWFDPARERDAALALVRQGADLLTHHTASPAVVQAAEQKGVKVIAYHSDMRRHAPKQQLAAVTHHWGPHYTATAREVLDGRWRVQPVWGGMAGGFVQLSALSPALPAAVRQVVQSKQADIVANRLRPFAGRLLDSHGRQRQAAGEAMSDAQIATMDWFVQGVAGTLPGG
jgi:basic membrane protein A